MPSLLEVGGSFSSSIFSYQHTWILVLFSCFKSIQVSSMLRQQEGLWTTFTSDASDVTSGGCPGGQGGNFSMLSVQLHPVSANIEISWNCQDLEWKQKCWKRLCLQHISKSWWLGVVFKFCFSRQDNGKASPGFPVPHLPSPSLRLVSLSKHRLHQVLKTEMQWGILDRAA